MQNRPKIKQYSCSWGNGDGGSSYGSIYAVDTEGFLYTWGYNGYSQLATVLQQTVTMLVVLLNHTLVVEM